jgi:hypothetical protein
MLKRMILKRHDPVVKGDLLKNSLDAEKKAGLFHIVCCLIPVLFLFACTSSPEPQNRGNSETVPTPIAVENEITPTNNAVLIEYATLASTCIEGLVFVEDLTIPDDSFFSPGSTLDKRWLIQNSGTCNWDANYRLRLINGEAFGASPEQALFPARAGMQAIIRIIFIAPQEPGKYISEWQAFDSNGIPFGDSFYIRFTIQ